MNRTVSLALGTALLPLTSMEASAHHVMGGGLPDTWVDGLLSIIGHSLIGIDHLAFVVALGFACAFLARRRSTPPGLSPRPRRAHGNVGGGRVEERG